MARELHRLSAVKVKNAAPGKHADGGGLWLWKRDDGGAQWVLRVTVHGRRHEMGLGSTDDVSLAQARREAERWRAVALSGVNPVRERERLRREAERNLHLLKDVAEDAFASRKAELKGEGAAGRWYSPLALHVLPKLGKTPVAEIDQVQSPAVGTFQAGDGNLLKSGVLSPDTYKFWVVIVWPQAFTTAVPTAESPL